MDDNTYQPNPTQVFNRELEEPIRAAAEAAGELDHIIPDLRRLAVRMGWLNMDPINANDHDPRNLRVIAGSFTAYGQRQSITVNWNDPVVCNRITVGNGRYISAKMLEWKWIAAAGTADDENDAMAYSMLDNRSSALSRPNYQQTAKNAKALQAAQHPILALMYDDDEVLPLLHEDFVAAPISDEQFDTTMVKGRSISKITASERSIVDSAIELCRAQNSKALTEGACLEKICKEYLEFTAVSTAIDGGLEPANGEDVLPLF